MSRTRGIVLFAFALLAAAAVADADVRQIFHLTYTTYPLDDAGTVDQAQAPTRYWYKGHRSRIDNFTVQGSQPRLTQSFIMDCDSSRMVTVNWSERTYTLMTFEEFQRMQEQMIRMASRFAGQMPGAVAARPRAGATGGTVTVTTAWRDSMLDEKRFGLPVRWVSSVATREASADACYPESSRDETHRWVTDLDLPLCIPPFDVKAMAAMPKTPAAGGCTDKVVEKTTGTPRPLGFVLREWTIGEGGRISGYEVTELSRDELADSLFAPPAGFKRLEVEMPQVSDAELDQAAAAMAAAPAGMPGAAPAAAAAKAPGAIRVGVAVKLAPDAPAAPLQVASSVAEWIRSQGLDAVPLSAADRAAALAEAPGVEADYVLFYDVEKAKAKVSGRGMLGAALGGAVGERAGGGAVQLEVEGGYELLLPNGERVTKGEIDEKQRAENPPEQLAAILEGAARAAIGAIRR